MFTMKYGYWVVGVLWIETESEDLEISATELMPQTILKPSFLFQGLKICLVSL